MFHLHPTRNFRKFLVNGKQPILIHSAPQRNAATLRKVLAPFSVSHVIAIDSCSLLSWSFSLFFSLFLDFIAISDCVFNNKNHYVLGHTGYQIIITILVISTLNANLRVATRVYDVEGGAIFSKNSTFVFFDGAAWTPRLRSPSPIMAPALHTKSSKPSATIAFRLTLFTSHALYSSMISCHCYKTIHSQEPHDEIASR